MNPLQNSDLWRKVNDVMACIYMRDISSIRNWGSLRIYELQQVDAEAPYLTVAIIDELYRPTTLMFNPNEDDTCSIAGGQLLIRLIPPDQHNLQVQRKKSFIITGEGNSTDENSGDKRCESD